MSKRSAISVEEDENATAFWINLSMRKKHIG
jgi:hypothetical protein